MAASGTESRGAQALRQPLSVRVLILVTMIFGGIVAYQCLDLELGQLVPRTERQGTIRDFFNASMSPAWTYESASVPADAPPFLWHVAQALLRTVIFAAAALSLALVCSLPLALLASSTWWEGDPASSSSRLKRWTRNSLAPTVQWGTRIAIALMRSVHELLWAVILLAAMGLNNASAVIAIAIPFTGTLAKIFSEMLDEAPRNSALALRGVGAPPAAVFLFGTLPRALPDMAAYAFYRFECAIRSSAILGFFGYETLGYYLSLSFKSLHYREVWTYLYALLLLVGLLEAWSGALRRRFMA